MKEDNAKKSLEKTQSLFKAVDIYLDMHYNYLAPWT